MPLFGSHGLLAQDIFHTTDSKQIETKVLEVSDDEVSNKMFNAANGVKIGPLGAKTAKNAPSGPNFLPLGALWPRTNKVWRKDLPAAKLLEDGFAGNVGCPGGAPFQSVPEVLAVQDAGEVPEVEAEGIVPVGPAVDAGGIHFDIGNAQFLAAFAERAVAGVEGVAVAAADEQQFAGVFGPFDAVDGRFRVVARVFRRIRAQQPLQAEPSVLRVEVEHAAHRTCRPEPADVVEEQIDGTVSAHRKTRDKRLLRAEEILLLDLRI